MVLPHPEHSFRRVTCGSTRGTLYCDCCNSCNRKSRSWTLGMQILGLADVLILCCNLSLTSRWSLWNINVLEISSTWARFAELSMKLLEVLVLKMVGCSTTRKVLWLVEQCNILEIPAPPSLGCSGCPTCGETRN